MGNETDWGKVLAVLLGAGAIGGGLYFILRPEAELKGSILSQQWDSENYRSGSIATCTVTVRNTGNVAFEPQIDAHLFYKRTFTDFLVSEHTSVLLGRKLEPEEEAQMVAESMVLPGIPSGWAEGKVVLYDADTGQEIDTDVLLNIAYIEEAETYFGNLVVNYAKIEGGTAMNRNGQGISNLGVQISPVKTRTLALRPHLRPFLIAQAFPIDCHPGDTIRSTFTFDFRGEAASYRFEVMMTETWHADVALVYENRALPRTPEITEMTVVFETQIPLDIYVSAVGTMYGARAKIHGAIGDIIWTPNVLNIFRVLPAAVETYFADLGVLYQKAS